MAEGKAAVITACAVIVGAAIGGFATWQGVREAEGARTRDDRAQERVQARGAARLLRLQLGATGSNIVTMTNSGRRYVPLDRAFSSTSPEDLRLIAAHLSATDFEYVSAGTANIQAVDALVRRRVEAAVYRIDAQTVIELEHISKTIAAALGALRPLRSVHYGRCARCITAAGWTGSRAQRRISRVYPASSSLSALLDRDISP